MQDKNLNILGKIIIAGIIAFFMIKYNYEVSRFITESARFLWDARGSIMTDLEREMDDAGLLEAFFLLIIYLIAALLTFILGGLGALVVWILVKLNNLYILPFILPLLVVYSKFSYAFIAKPLVWIPKKTLSALLKIGRVILKLLNLFVYLPFVEVLSTGSKPAMKLYRFATSLLFLFGSISLIIGISGVIVTIVQKEQIVQFAESHLEAWFKPNDDLYAYNETQHVAVVLAYKEYWTETGIHLRKGDIVSFTATGVVKCISPFKPGLYTGGPDGILDGLSSAGFISPVRLTNSYRIKGFTPANYILDKYAINALMGKIGTGNPFFIGSSREFKVSRDGDLFLGINQLWQSGAWKKNKGKFEVNIIIKRR